METFTIHNNSKVDKYISIILEEIVDDILSPSIKNKIVDIILTGGFGKSEGGLYYSKTHKKMQILNDIDLLVILKPNFFINYFFCKKYIEDKVNKISIKYNIKQIDLSFRSVKMLKNSKFTVANYEIKNGYKNLYSNFSLFDSMPNYNNEKIPIEEGKNYLFNRGSGLLIPLLYLKYFKLLELKEQQWVNFHVETNKAIIAIGDSILIEKKLYHYSYLKRMEIFKKISNYDFPNFDLLKDKYIYALECKLMVESENKSIYGKINYKNMKNDLLDIIKIFENYFIFFEQKRLSVKINNWINYHKLVSKSKRNINFSDLSRIYSLFKKNGIIKLLINKNVRNKIHMVNNTYLISVLPLLLFSFKNKGFDINLVSLACKCLKVHFDKNNLKTSWKNCVIKYLSIWHPEGESGKISFKLKDYK